MTTLTPIQSTKYHPPVRALLFGGSGSGKTTSLVSLLKNPKLKLRVLAIDANSTAGLFWAIQNAGISLIPEQLIVSEFKLTAAQRAKLVASFNSPLGGQAKAFGHKWLLDSLVSFNGIDLATGLPTACGGIHTFDTDTVLIIDSWTTYQDHLIKSLEATPNERTRNLYGDVQINTGSLMTSLLAAIDCHLIVLAHSKIVETGKMKEYNGSLTAPALFGNAAIETFRGYFADVIYCQRLGDKFLWTVRDVGVLATTRSIPFEKLKLKSTACPADFLTPGYMFFP